MTNHIRYVIKTKIELQITVFVCGLQFFYCFDSVLVADEWDGSTPQIITACLGRRNVNIPGWRSTLVGGVLVRYILHDVAGLTA